MTIGLLTAGVKGAVGNSTGRDVADTVNGLITGATPVEAITIKGLPQTTGAPAGYGDLASAVNGLIDVVGAESVKAVTAVDYYNITTLTNYGDTAYGYRDGATSQIVAINTVSGAESNFGVALPVTGIRSIKFVSQSIVLCEADGGTGIYTMYRSADSGASWAAVITPTIQQVRMLTDRSICVANISGQTVLIYGEYNVNVSRVSGSTNDAVRLLRSDDLGATWSEVTRWNTDGSTRNIRHIHCVKQDPVTKRIYVATGDSNSESAIYRWDGVTAWPVNVTPADLVQSAGLMVQTGAQRFRAVDINFRGDYLYWMPDTNSGALGYMSEVGIWKIHKSLDLSTLERISTCNLQLKGHAGWLTADGADGSMFWITGIDSPAAGFLYSAIIRSNQSLSDWQIVGAMRSMSSGNVTPFSFFKNSADNLFLSISNASGKAANSTAVFRSTTKAFAGAFKKKLVPDTIHPVYWCNSSGSNSNNGHRPSSAFLTLDYALTGDRVTYGAEIYLGAGKTTYIGGNISPKFNANARSGDTTEMCYIAGVGATESSFVVLSGATATIAFSLLVNGNAVNLGFKDLTVYAEGNIRVADVLGAANTIGAIRAIVGDCNFINPSLIRVEAGFIRSISSVFYVSGNGITSPNSGTSATNIDLSQCVIAGGADQIKLTTTGAVSQFTLQDVIFSGFTSNAIDTTADFASISAVGCSFHSAAVGAAALSGATATWNGKFNGAKASAGVGVPAAFDASLSASTDYGFDLADYVY